MSDQLTAILVLSAAGACGCAARVLARDAIMLRGVHAWVAVLAINLLGAAAMGAVAALAARSTFGSGASGERAVLACTGFLGGWTTYSAFSMDFIALWLRGQRTQAALLWTATIVGAPICAWLAAVAISRFAGSGA